MLEPGFDAPKASKITFGRFVLDVPGRMLRFQTARVSLRPKEFDVLVLLAESAGKPVTKDQIITRAWPNEEVSDAALTQTVYRLRRTLTSFDSSIDHIQTIPGQGYQFVVPISRAQNSAIAHEVSDEAFKDYRRAVSLLEKSTEESIEQSIYLLEDSLQRDPRYVAALTCLAEAYVLGARLRYIDPRFAYAVATRRAGAALDLDPSSVDALAVWSSIALLFERDTHAAIEAANSSVSVAPHSLKARNAAVWAYVASKNHDMAVAHAKEAILLDPSSADSTALLGAALYFAGRFEDACSQCYEALDLQRTNRRAKQYLARALCALGAYDDAARAAHRLHADLAYTAIALEGYIAGRTGDTDTQMRALSALSSAPVLQHVWTALVLLGSERISEALANIRAAATSRDPDLVFARHDPLFNESSPGIDWERLSLR